MLELMLASNIHLNSHLIERAWQEPAFEQALVSQPNATLSAALNVRIPADVKYVILKDTPNLYHLALPFVPTSADAAETLKIYRVAAADYDPAYEETLLKLFQRARTDSAFRQQLLDNPDATLAAELQFVIPANIHFKVVESSQNLRYLVLPQPLFEETAMESGLTETDLTMLAGGLSSHLIVCSSSNTRHRSAMARC